MARARREFVRVAVALPALQTCSISFARLASPEQDQTDGFIILMTASVEGCVS